MVVVELYGDGILEESQLKTQVELLHSLPKKVLVSKGFKNHTPLVDVRVVVKDIVSCTCLVRAEVCLTGYTVCSLDLESVKPCKVFHELVVVYVQTCTCRPEHTHLLFCTE